MKTHLPPWARELIATTSVPSDTMFNFSPLQGALSQSPATQSLLELDGGVKVLIGLGWDESFDVSKLKELEKYACVLVV